VGREAHAGRPLPVRLNALVLLLRADRKALSPGAARADMHGWLALAHTQADIVARHYLKLLVYVSDTVLVHWVLGHADDAAVPVLVWPEPTGVGTGIYTEVTSAR
jgi:hypothetical protein